MKKYVVVEVLAREISTPRIYDTFAEANKDMCDCFAQVKGYNDWDDLIAHDPNTRYLENDYYDEVRNEELANDYAYTDDDWDIEIFEMELDEAYLRGE